MDCTRSLSKRGTAGVLAALLALLWLTACNPTVRVAPPEEPIVINMNVKIEHEIHVKVDKDLEEAFEGDPEIF